MSFTKSVDLYNYLLKNHHRRVAVISFHIGKAYGLNEEQLSNLVIAAALHDIGALTVSERDDVMEKTISKSLTVELDMNLLEQFAYTISKIIDCRSSFTISHSFSVSAVAYKIAEFLNYSEEKRRELRVAGLLHNIGKITIPSELIEKNGKLTPAERTNVQAHAYYADVILKDLDRLDGITNWAAHHHENHDGSGYPENLTSKNISEEMDILAYADIYTALSEDRPYRVGLSQEEISVILKEQLKEKHGKKIYHIIIDHLPAIDEVCKSAIRDGINRFEIYEEVARKYEAEEPGRA